MATPLALLDLRVTMDDALADLIAAKDVSGRSPRTLSLYSTHVSRLIAFLADDGIENILNEVTPGAITKFLAAEKARGLKPASLHISLRTIRSFFEWCVEQGHLDSNPAKRVSSPRVVIEPVQFMTADQLKTLIANIGNDKTVEGVRDGALIRVARDTGVRRGELVGMHVEDVDLVERTIVVRAITSKNRKGRTVPVAKDTVTALRTYLRVRQAYLQRMKRRDSEMLWIASKGDLSGNGALQALHRRLRAAGLPKVTMHSLRHRWAATVIEDGLPMPYVVALGGWANAVMPTSRYGQFGVQERSITAMQALLDR